MKLRTGFVSNSSSSSFVIWYKDDLTKENLIKAMGVDKNNPLYFFADDLSDYVITESKDSYNKPIDTFEELAKAYGFISRNDENPDLTEAIEELPEEYNRFKNGFKMLSLCPSYNEADSAIEYYLGNTNTKVLADTDTIYMEVGE